MPESAFHRRVRRLLRPSDLVGQPFGEALVVVDTVERGNVRIKDGPAKGREVDVFVEAPEGYRVAVEFNYRHKVDDYKIAQLREDGRYPVLEVDLPESLGNSTDIELRKYIAGGNVFADEGLSEVDRDQLRNPRRRWLYVPSLQDVIRQFAPGQIKAWDWVFNHARFDCRGISLEEIERRAVENDRRTRILFDQTPPYGRLRCCVPGCKGQVCGGASTEEPYETLPRFSCSDHTVHPQVLTHPEGVLAFPTPFQAIVDTSRSRSA